VYVKKLDLRQMAADRWTAGQTMLIASRTAAA
jgi:hypothetical protein